jgi:cytochrome c553
MRRYSGFLPPLSKLLLFAPVSMLLTATPAFTQDAPPAWAYPVNPPGFKLPPDDGKPRRVPDSDVTYTLGQVRDRFLAPDWHPGDHPPMPEIVARGRKPDVFACGFCHRADGPGGPENANIAGLPVAYIVQQMADFRSGARRSSVQKRAPTELKASMAKAITDAEVQAAAAYFAALKPRQVVRVVESGTAPKTYVTGWFLAAASGDKEPIGNRIVEVPEVLERFVLRDARARFIAYVPVGSIERGRALASRGDGTFQCAACHGPDLRGLGDIPGIAGRSPTYTFRQLYDYKSGARSGPDSEPMKAIARQLTLDDMIALSAYTASLSP